jgi:hypothetical protein
MRHAQAIASMPTDTLNIFGRPLSIFGVPVERQTIFSDHKGNYRSRVERRQRKLIVKSTFIKFYLRHDERVLCLTTGYSPVSVHEQLLTGPAFLFFKRAIFVFTDQRILHIPTRFDHSAMSAISQILYGDCSRVDLKGRSLIVDYKNGHRELFPYMGRKEKKKLRTLLDGITLESKASSQRQERIYLCPSCTNVLEAGQPVCPTCKMAFKSGRKAKIRSLLIPGGGYLYNRQTLPGITAGLLETALLSCLAYFFASLKAGMPVSLGTVALLLALFIGEKFVASFHSQQMTQDFIPEEKDFAMRKI